MIPQETLFTDRLKLRPLKDSDAEAIFAYFSLDQVVKYYDLSRFEELSQAETLIERWIARREKGEGERWVITLKEDDKCLGTIGFVDIDSRNRSSGVGYELHPDNWNSGIATEALVKIVRQGFEVRNFHRLWAMTDPSNLASQKVLQKNGFRHEGTLKESAFEKGEFVDEAIFGLLKSEWTAELRDSHR